MSRGLDKFNSSYVYRVLRPNEDHTSDLTCCAPRSRRTVDEHVATGLKDPSRFISTTSSRERALKWLETANEKSSWRYNNSREMIVRIDVDLIKREYPELADSAYDLTNDMNRNHFLKTMKQRSFSAAYNEVVFKDVIPREAVSVEYVRGIGTVRDRQAQATSLATTNRMSLRTMPPLYHEPSVAYTKTAIPNLPTYSRDSYTRTSSLTGRLAHTNSDVIQRDRSISVSSHTKPHEVDKVRVCMTNLDHQRSERIHSTNSNVRNYDSSRSVLSQVSNRDKPSVPDVTERKIPKIPSRNLSYKAGYLPTPTSRLSTERRKSTDTYVIRPNNSTGVVLQSTTAKPIATLRVIRDRSYPGNGANRFAELRPYMTNDSLRVSQSSFPERVSVDEVSNCKNNLENDIGLNTFSFATLIRRVCCCFCCHVD